MIMDVKVNSTVREFFYFFQVHVDGSGQSHVTEACKNTLDPKWNVHYDLFVGSNDAITISVWNDKKVSSISNIVHVNFQL